MGVRNHRPDLNGVLVIDKPLAVTSAHCCRVVRRITRGAKVGHAGTLDPLATGLLVLCLGKATKAIDTLMDGVKRYTAEVDLSAFSTTDDGEGERTPVDVATPPTLDDLRAALDADFIGPIAQRPPAFSAVKIDGERAYRLARRGAPRTPDAKTVTIHRIDILDFRFPSLTLDIRCSKGTYIRSIARDLGATLNTGGMLTALRRTESLPFTLEHASNAGGLPDTLEPGDLLPFEDFLPTAPARIVDPDDPAP